MASTSDKERLIAIETTLAAVKVDVEELTKAVSVLTATLEQSKGAKKLLGWIVGGSVSIATLVITIKELLHR